MSFSPAEISIIILAIIMVLYITEVIPLAVTAIGSCIALVVTGAVPAKTVWGGLSSDTNLLIAGMIIVGAAMFETGLAKKIGTTIVGLAGDSPFKTTLAILLVTMALSGFLNNSSTTAMMVPVALGIVIASNGKLKDKHIQMPLAIAAVAGGMLTLVGSTPQVIVSGVLDAAGYGSLSFFECGKMGALLCVVILIYTFTIGKWMSVKIWGADPQPGPRMLEMMEMETAKGSATEEEKENPKMWVTAGILVGCILLFIFSGWPLGTVAMIGALTCVITGCLTEKRAYQLQDWTTVLVLGGSIGFATGLDVSGGGQLIADTVLGWFGDDVSLWAIFAVMSFVGMLLTQFMSNTAATAMMAPILLAIAQGIGANPFPMLLGLAMCTNASFSTPVATPPMTIVLGAGYRFMDYVKWAGPINLICWIVVIFSVQIIYGSF
jgi:sodium-dependent dicarboxylate transporter 2/3/5